MNIEIGIQYNPTENDKQVLRDIHELNLYGEWANRDVGELFHFVDGPPFVSSDNLHYGHLLISLMKSTTLYYQRMNGHAVLNEQGFDTHGLPIEMAVNKLLGVQTRKDVMELGIDKYNAYCKETIQKYSNAWQPIFDSIGRITDPKKQYKTMDTPFMESVWWVFKQLWEKGLIYKGVQVMPYSPACNTPLSNFEAGQNYKDVEDMTIYVGFRLLNDIPFVDYMGLPHIVESDGTVHKDIYILAWTTTPWTLPANLALCINRDANYVIIHVRKLNKILLMAENSVRKVFPDYSLQSMDYNILEIVTGISLVGLEYEPLYQYETTREHHWRILEDDFVQCWPYEKDKSPGSGVVHLAPGFGEDDFRVCKKSDINLIYTPIDENGYYIMEGPLQGRFYRDCNKDIIRDLEGRGLIVKKENYRHSYPFCYRTDTPLMYRAMDAWFVAVTQIKEDLLANNAKVNWYPSHVGSGRFHNWLENTRDWCISRNRFFGTPIPIWQSADGDTIVVGSIAELAQLANISEDQITDLHMEFVDNLVITRDGKHYKRVEAVFDCWFESGSVPYGQIHYPFAPKTDGIFDGKEALCDFICEGIDQTRGWFYTLHVLATALFNKPAFKNVVCAGLILASDGHKMAKRLGNYVAPQKVIEEYGADALRLYMLRLPATYAEASRFKDGDIKTETKTLIQWVNSIKFLIEHIKMYEGVLETKYKYQSPRSTNPFDNWIISRLNTTIRKINSHMANYEFTKYVDTAYDFIEDYTNWYLKFNRDRLKGKETAEDWLISLNTCVYVANQFNLAITPITPFLSHTVHKNFRLMGIYNKKSAILEKFPEPDSSLVDMTGENKFQLFQKVGEIIRSLRSQVGLGSVKIPIREIYVYLENMKKVGLLEEVIDYFYTDEINVLSIQIREMCKPQLVGTMDLKYGKTYRSQFIAIKNALMNLSQLELEHILLEPNGETLLEGVIVPNKTISVLRKSTVQVGENHVSMERDGIMVVLDKTQDKSVQQKHFLRMLVYNTQLVRKNSGIRPWNKISFYYDMPNIYDEFRQELELALGYPIVDSKLENKMEWSSNNPMNVLDKTIHLTIYNMD